MFGTGSALNARQGRFIKGEIHVHFSKNVNFCLLFRVFQDLLSLRVLPQMILDAVLDLPSLYHQRMENRIMEENGRSKVKFQK